MITAVETKFSISPKKLKNLIGIASNFIETKDKNLKQLFNDFVIEFPEKEKLSYGIIHCVNPNELFQIVFPLEETVENKENIKFRIPEKKLKGIIDNFAKDDEIINMNIKEKIKISSKNTSITSRIIPVDDMEDFIENMKIKEEQKIKLTKIPADKFLRLLNQVSFIAKIDKIKPIKITFEKDKIKASSLQKNGHYAAYGEIPHLNITHEESFSIPALTTIKIINVLKILKEQEISIYTDIYKSKLQIKSKILNLVFNLDNTVLPNVEEKIISLINTEMRSFTVNADDLINSLSLISSICGEITLISINAFKDRLVIETENDEKIIKEIEAITDNEEIKCFVITKTLVESIKTCINESDEDKQIKICVTEDGNVLTIQQLGKEFPAVAMAGAYIQ